MAVTISGTIRGMGTKANPTFVAGAVVIPVVALVYNGCRFEEPL